MLDESLQTTRASRTWQSSIAAAAAFTVYFSMYGFRKPFSAADYAGVTFLNSSVTLKTALVIGQLVGYALSKYLSVRICAELPRGRLVLVLAALGIWAQVALLLFAVVPGNCKVMAIFANGLPLGVVWGLVVRYLEGRSTTDFLMAILCCSFILAGGVVKDVGRFWMGCGVPQFWMPLVTGLCFFPSYLIGVWVLNRLPAPDEQDIQERNVRHEMNAVDRTAFLKRYATGLIPLFVLYLVMTCFRDFRDSYALEILADSGYGGIPGALTAIEIPVAFGVTAVMAMLVLVKDHHKSLLAIYGCLSLGIAMIALATALHLSQHIDGLVWMTIVGFGGYLTYVPLNSVVFERIMALTRCPGTAVFAFSIADALGYTGSIGVQLHKDLLAGNIGRALYFERVCIATTLIGLITIATSAWFFLYQMHKSAHRTEHLEPLSNGPIVDEPIMAGLSPAQAN